MYISSFCSIIRAKVVVLLVTLMGSVILSSCSNDDGTLLPDNLLEANKRHISFIVNLKGKWENNNVSRTAPSNSLVEQFGVYGGYYNASDELLQTMNYMWDTESGEYMDAWQTANAFSMPPLNKEMSFYAYYPYQFVDDTIQYIKFNGNDTLRVGMPFFDFKIPSNALNQVDLMVATSKMKSDSLITGNAINLHFSHLLTAVRFTIDESVQKGFIREISIDSVSSGGSLYFEDDTNDWRTVNDSLGSYKLTADIRVGSGEKVTLADDYTFMMMPQFLGGKAVVTIKYDNGQLLTLTSSLAGKHWEKGKIVKYNIKINSLNNVTLTSTVEPWEDGETFSWESSF